MLTRLVKLEFMAVLFVPRTAVTILDVTGALKLGSAPTPLSVSRYPVLPIVANPGTPVPSPSTTACRRQRC